MNIYTAHINSKIADILKYLVYLFLLVSPLHSVFCQITSPTHSLSKANLTNRYERKIDSLKARGYFSAKVVSTKHDTLQQYFIDKGPSYQWAKLSVSKSSGAVDVLNLTRFIGKTADFVKLGNYLDDYVKNKFHHNGYPFATANVLITDIKDTMVEGSIEINLKNKISYDSITLSEQIVHQKYLANYLNMEQGDLWSTKDFLLIQSRINDLSVMGLQEKPALSFAKGQAVINLTVTPLRNNHFDAIIGIAPGTEEAVVTGQVDLGLTNLFKRAIHTAFKWRSFSQGSQTIYGRFNQQKSFSSSFGYDAHFTLLKQDSSFINIDYSLSTNYIPAASWYTTIGFNKIIRNVLNAGSQNADNNVTPLRSSEVNAVIMGINYKNPLLFPQIKSHNFFQINYSIGQKTIKNYESLPSEWQNVAENSINHELQLLLSKQWKVTNRTVIEARFTQHSIINNALSRNDLLRLGGLNSLRGFDQNFLFTSSYGLINLDHRFFLNQQSNIFAVTDVAYLQDPARWLYGVGLGLDAKTKSGWFRFIYAIGSQLNEKIKFSDAKIHLGYIAVF